MKPSTKFTCVLTLCLLGALGCEHPASVPGVAKPKGPPQPPGEAGPLEIAYSVPLRKQGFCIQAMAADGGNVVTVQCGESGTFGNFQPTWAPGGAAIAYESYTLGDIQRVDIAADGSGTNQQTVLSAADCGGRCGQPQWSPQGDEIAVLGSGGALLLVPATGCGAPEEETCPRVLYTADVRAVAWNSAGTQLALAVSRPENTSEVVVMSSDGVFTESVLSFDKGIQFIDWARQGSETLVFNVAYGVDSPRFDIYLFERSPDSSPVLLAAGRHPSFSPDNNFIVYEEMVTNGHQTNLTGMYTLNLNTGSKTKLAGDGRGADWKR